MPFIAYINEMFPEPQGPYTLKEITLRIQQLYDPGISYSRVHHAYDQCRKCAATAHIVVPLNPGQKHLYVSAEAARRIARRVTNCRPPKRINFTEKDLEAARQQWKKEKSVSTSNQRKIKPRTALVKTG